MSQTSTLPLTAKALHDKWKADYRNAENQAFYDLAYDAIGNYLGPAPGLVLDAGCGTGEKTLRLAKRGFDVVGVDFAPETVAEARATATHPRVTIQQADLTALPFADGKFDAVVIWGVLMHVPDLPRAISELCRVLRPGGRLVICDNNLHSLDVQLLRLAKRVKARERPQRTAYGLENWTPSPDGLVMVRWHDMRGVERLLAACGVTVEQQRAGRFTELFVYMPSLLRPLVHRWNQFCFSRLGWRSAAYGRLLFARKA
jgi:SAM-dependent methyltransferase